MNHNTMSTNDAACCQPLNPNSLFAKLDNVNGRLIQMQSMAEEIARDL